MAWSGDVLYYKIWEDQPFEFIMPEVGAMLWIDNMLIPANSANPAGALEMMDFYYKPEIAQLVTEFVLYMSPVPAVQDLIAEHAKEQKTKDPEYSAQLAETAENPMLWPDEALLQKVSLGRPLTTRGRVAGLARHVRSDLGAVGGDRRRLTRPAVCRN